MKRPNVKDYNLTDTDSLADYIMAWNEYSNLLKIERDEFIAELINLSEIGQDNTGDPTFTLSQKDLDKLLNKEMF